MFNPFIRALICIFTVGRPRFLTASVSSTLRTISGKVPFDNVISRQGTEYDSTTGVYTVAEDGLCVFYVNIMVLGGNRCQGYISKDGVQMAWFYSESSGNHQMGGNIVVLGLVKGDNVYIQTYGCNYIHQTKFSIFAGFKLA